MNKVRISILILTFLGSIFLPLMPSWIYDNFWGKAEFWDSWGFRIPYLLFITLYALLMTVLVEALIRFIKKFT